MTVQALLFDLDGTLTDTFELWYQAVAEMVRRHAGRELDREEYRLRWWGMDGRGKLRQLLPDVAAQRLEPLYAELVDLLIAKAPLVRPLPGRREAIEEASSRLPLAVISNGPRAFLDAQLRQVGFDGRFAVCVADAEPKPSPEGILRACRDLGLGPADALFVGDSRFDRLAAEAAGTALLIVGEKERLDEVLKARLADCA